ncbi:SAP domain-containing protein [Diplocarpon rosae]|nr:SAP domain-containing protein [Diplocarpon rosae]
MTDWNKLKVADLRAELKRRGLPQTGLKPVLVARLAEAEAENANEHEHEDGTESEATVQALDVSSAAAPSPDSISPVLVSASADASADPSAPQTREVELDAVEKIEELEEAPQAQTVESQAEPLLASSKEVAQDQQPEPLPPTMEEQSPVVEPHASALPSVEPREANEDQKKRKRRSQSPPLSATDSARKRFRTDDETRRAASTHSDDGLVEQHGVDAITIAQDTEDIKMEDVNETGADDNTAADMADRHGVEGALDNSTATSTSRRDSRFKGLFPETTHPTTMSDVHGSEERELERLITPSIHPATPALYIRDFMRPLNPGQLQSHLAYLAAPPGQQDDPDVISNFYIDPIRTHAFVSFTKVSAAARVRSALHDRIWPDEKTRKPLWVDFVPAEKVEQWIEQEQDMRGGGRGGVKWEVLYDTNDEGIVTATLQEVGSILRSSQNRQPSMAESSPHTTEPRDAHIPTSPLQSRGQATAFSTGRERLDVLFNCTTSKPALYWQPVSKEIVGRRMSSISESLSKDAASGLPVQGDIHRYTFEEDMIVDRGPEIFPGIRPPPGFRGPSGFGPRGGGSGGFQSRGGYPPQYRSGPHHAGRGGYDSYRGVGGRDRGDRREDRRFDRWDNGRR